MNLFQIKLEKRVIRHGKGSVLLFTLMVMIVLTSIVGTYLGLVQSHARNIDSKVADSQALYLADAGMNMAIWYLMNTAPDGSADCSWRTAAYPTNPGPNVNDPQEVSLGEGTFTIWVQDSGSDIKVHARGTVDELSRVIMQTLAITSEALDRCIHADGAHLRLTNSSGTINGNMSCFISVLPDPLQDSLTITGDIVQGDEQVKVRPDFVLDYYYSLAESAGQIVSKKTFSNATYTGIWYITNEATIGNNARIEGSVISEKSIKFEGKANNVFIDPALFDSSQNYPALYAGTSISSTDKGRPPQRVGLRNSTINGLILAGNNITFDYIHNSTFNGTVLAGNNIDMENGTNLTINYKEAIFSPMPAGLTFSGEDKRVLPQKDWQEI